MNKREYNKLLDELKTKCFPPRPRRLKLHYKRNGQPVMMRKQDRSYFQMKAKEPKCPIYIDVPAKKYAPRCSAYSMLQLLGQIYDYLCDKLF